MTERKTSILLASQFFGAEASCVQQGWTFDHIRLYQNLDFTDFQDSRGLIQYG